METEIISFEFSPLNMALTEPFSIASGTQNRVENILVTIALKNGKIGLGEAAPFPAVSGETQQSTMEALAELKSLVLGKDAKQWRGIALELERKKYFAPAARCAIEMALLDAFAKSFGMPLYVYFGAAGTELETDMTITTGSVEHSEKSAMAIHQRNINFIKVKTVGKDIEFDVRRIMAVHKVAPHLPICVDGNCGYTVSDSIDFLQKLEKHNIKLAFFEQPLAASDIDGLAQIARETGVKMAADESARSSKDVLNLIGKKAASVINIKFMKSGVSEALKMIAIAEAAGLELMMGGMVESILAMTFSAHIAAGKGTFQYIDLDTPMFISDHPFKNGFKQLGGKLILDPNLSGHGVGLAY